VEKMRYSLKTSKRMYGPKYHSGCKASSLDVRSKVWQGTLFNQSSESSCFLILGLF
jgi:hypothetical protein